MERPGEARRSQLGRRFDQPDPISDNGRGITEYEKAGRLYLGILGMRERAHLIGGEFEITGLEGKGTLVTVRVPLSAKQTAGTVS